MQAITSAVLFVDSETGRQYIVHLIPENQLTDDPSRRFPVGPISWRDGRLPFTFSDREGDPHNEALHVGNLFNLRRESIEGTMWVMADLDWDIDELALEAKRLVDEDRITGVSITPTDLEAFLICGTPDMPTAESVRALAAEFDPETCAEEEWTEAWINVVIGSATLLMMPAFEDAEVITAAVGTVHDYPMADRGRAWDAAAANGRWREFTESAETPSASYRNGFLWWDGEGETYGDYKLQVVDVIDGATHYVPRGIFATAGGRGVDAADIPSDDKDRVKNLICRLYGKIEDGPPCPFAEEAATSVPVASDGLETAGFVPTIISGTAEEVEAIRIVNAPVLTIGDDMRMAEALAAASTDLKRPPADWFTDPGLTEPTPLTIDDKGKVAGHLALWSTCHRGFDANCVTPPQDATDYAEFHDNTRVMLDTGELLGVGCLTVDVSHADIRASAEAAKRHYDHSGTTVAQVRAGQDEHGVWLAGAVVPWATADNIEKLRRLSLSGDWRPKGGSYFLIAAQAVPVPGFPIRAKVASGIQVSLTTVGPANIPPSPLVDVSDMALVATAVAGLADMIRDLRAEISEERRLKEYQKAQELFAEVPA